MYPDTIFKLTPRYYENQKQGKFLHDFHQRIIDERREILRNNNNNESESTDKNYNIFIDHILNNEGMFSDEDIQHHVITVLSAGDDYLHKKRHQKKIIIFFFSRPMSREFSRYS